MQISESQNFNTHNKISNYTIKGNYTYFIEIPTVTEH